VTGAPPVVLLLVYRQRPLRVVGRCGARLCGPADSAAVPTSRSCRFRSPA